MSRSIYLAVVGVSLLGRTAKRTASRGSIIPSQAPPSDSASRGQPCREGSHYQGLGWLARHQAADGHWSLDKSTDKSMKNDTAGTAFGLLPFLAAGVTHKGGKGPAQKYSKTVAAGLDYLLKQQRRDGSFPGSTSTHGLATMAVCEAYSLTSDPKLRRTAQFSAQRHRGDAEPEDRRLARPDAQGGNPTATGWQLQALKSGQMAGLSVPQRTLDGVWKWLDSCESPDKGGYGYPGGKETPTITAVGLLCRMYLGTPRRNRALRKGISKLKKWLPTRKPNTYYEYYATQVMYHLGGDDSKFWNKGDGKKFKGMRGLLLERQDKDGSWNPADDPSAASGGRLTTTSLSLLTLEIYLGHLPLFQRANRPPMTDDTDKLPK